MDPNEINQTNFCNKRVENIISNDLKKYILEDIKNRTSIQFNSRYAKIFNDQYKNNLKNPHIACLKTSGSPYLLFCTKINNINYSLLIDKKINTGHVYPKIFLTNFKFNDELYEGTLFEAELLRDKNNKWQLMLADIYYYKNNVLVKKKDIIHRINTIHNILNDEIEYKETDICDILIKKYFEIKDINELFKEFVHTLNYNIRGIYFIPINIKYSNLLYIIKESDLKHSRINNNLNFKIVKHQKPEIYELYLKNNDGFQKIDYAYINDIKTSKYILELFSNTEIDDIIVECEYNKYYNKWRPLKSTDKLISHIKDYDMIKSII
mgnify:CR=1 FL=1